MENLVEIPRRQRQNQAGIQDFDAATQFLNGLFRWIGIHEQMRVCPYNSSLLIRHGTTAGPLSDQQEQLLNAVLAVFSRAGLVSFQRTTVAVQTPVPQQFRYINFDATRLATVETPAVLITSMNTQFCLRIMQQVRQHYRAEALMQHAGARAPRGGAQAPNGRAQMRSSAKPDNIPEITWNNIPEEIRLRWPRFSLAMQHHIAECITKKIPQRLAAMRANFLDTAVLPSTFQGLIGAQTCDIPVTIPPTNTTYDLAAVLQIRQRDDNGRRLHPETRQAFDLDMLVPVAIASLDAQLPGESDVAAAAADLDDDVGVSAAASASP